MSCPHCGERLITKVQGTLCCCRCGRPRTDLQHPQRWAYPLSSWSVLVGTILALPLALGMAATDALRHSSGHGQSSPAPQIATRADAP
jgi:DNA-directed RNA polymerase subunit RPC12/RpoP